MHIPTNSGQENPLSRYAQETTQDAVFREFSNYLQTSKWFCRKIPTVFNTVFEHYKAKISFY